MAWILIWGALALFAGTLGVRAYMRRRRRNWRRQRSIKNRGRQFGWEMVFGPRKLRLTHKRTEPDSE